MTPERAHAVLAQYLEGAITFAELIAWLAEYHKGCETIAADADQCANCGGKLSARR